jgi:hypothetical protein
VACLILRQASASTKIPTPIPQGIARDELFSENQNY